MQIEDLLFHRNLTSELNFIVVRSLAERLKWKIL